jgi:hypothetical protein
MKRIDSPNRAVALFGAGKDGFKAAVPGVASATELTPAWFNGMQEAVIRTIEAAGLVPTEGDFDQFTTALEALMAEQIAAVVGAAPETLNQIDELAAAIGDDPNFAVTLAALLDGKERKFAAGTRMLFQQSAAPVGWTKVLTHDNKALRVVSGAVGSGGAIDFTAAFVNGNVGATGLTIAQIPSHTHTVNVPTYSETGIGNVASGGNTFDVNFALNTDATGGGATHSHTINLDVKYVDIIIASKD